MRFVVTLLAITALIGSYAVGAPIPVEDFQGPSESEWGGLLVLMLLTKCQKQNALKAS